MTVAVIVSYALLAVASVVLWVPAIERLLLRMPWWPVMGALVVGLSGTAFLVTRIVGLPGEDQVLAVVVCSMLVATCGGGPVTVALLRGVEHSGVAGVSDSPEVRPVITAAPSGQEVLRGGAWIGLLERAAVAGSLLVGIPEGVAVTVAVKGLARYPELRVAGASERFIIGTFASTLWAASAAGVANLLRP